MASVLWDTSKPLSAIMSTARTPRAICKLNISGPIAPGPRWISSPSASSIVGYLKTNKTTAQKLSSTNYIPAPIVLKLPRFKTPTSSFAPAANKQRKTGPICFDVTFEKALSPTAPHPAFYVIKAGILRWLEGEDTPYTPETSEYPEQFQASLRKAIDDQNLSGGNMPCTVT